MVIIFTYFGQQTFLSPLNLKSINTIKPCKVHTRDMLKSDQKDLSFYFIMLNYKNDYKQLLLEYNLLISFAFLHFLFLKDSRLYQCADF